MNKDEIVIVVYVVFAICYLFYLGMVADLRGGSPLKFHFGDTWLYRKLFGNDNRE
jgi:hypothetical protein